MAAQNINLTVDSPALTPLLAAQLVSAFYSALVLKKLSGVEITPEVEKNVWGEVLELWAKTEEGIVEGKRALDARRARPSPPGHKQDT